jgi:hypothetical protein
MDEKLTALAMVLGFSVLLLAGCLGGQSDKSGSPTPSPAEVSPSPTTTPTATSTPTPEITPTPETSPTPTPPEGSAEAVKKYTDITKKSAIFKEMDNYSLTLVTTTTTSSSDDVPETTNKSTAQIVKYGNNLKIIQKSEDLFVTEIYVWNGKVVTCFGLKGDVSCTKDENTDSAKIMMTALEKGLSQDMDEGAREFLSAIAPNTIDVNKFTFADLFAVTELDKKMVDGRECQEFKLVLKWEPFLEELSKVQENKTSVEDMRKTLPTLQRIDCLDLEYGISLESENVMSMQYSGANIFVKTTEKRTISFDVSEEDVKPSPEALEVLEGQQ